MYKQIYKIKKWQGISTDFHLKYYVHDGLGMFFFNSLLECRNYVRRKSLHLEIIYNESKKLFNILSSYYFDKLIKFRLYDFDNQKINKLLSDCLNLYSYLSKSSFPQYILPKLRVIYDNFLLISRLLNFKLLENRISKIKTSFFVEYPIYKSVKKSSAIIIKNEQKKCAI